MSVLVARKLGLTDFGIYALVLSLYNLFERLSSSWLEDILIREISYDSSQARFYFSHCVVIGVFTCTLCYFLLIILGEVMNYPIVVQNANCCIGILLFPAFLYFLLETIFISFQKPQYALKAALYRDISMIIMGYFVLNAGYGITSLIKVIILSRVIGLTALLYYASKNGIELSSDLSWSFLKNILKIAPIFMGGAIGANIYVDMDTLILPKVISISEFGIYNIVKKVVRSGHILYFSVITPYVPSITKSLQSSHSDRSSLHKRIMLTMFGVILFAILFILFAAPFTIHFFYGEQFMPALKYLRILVWALVPISLNHLLTRYLIVAHQQNKVLLGTTYGIVILAATGVIFSLQWKGIGMAAAYTVSSFIMAGISYCFTQTLLKYGLRTNAKQAST